MKSALIALLVTIFLAIFFIGAARDISDRDVSLYTFGLEHVSPKIMIEAGTVEPNGTIFTESEASGGTIYGTIEVDNLTADGLVAVDGQVLVGDRLWSPLVMVVSSRGNRHSAGPDEPTVTWKDVKIHGSLTIHGSLIVHGNLSPLGNLAISGVMGPACRPGRIFFPAGAYPMASAVHFGCSTIGG